MQADVFRILQRARFLIAPSLCYENFPMAVVEAFACGVPVIASNGGSLPELISERRTGLTFASGNAEALNEQVTWAWANPGKLREMRQECRAEFERNYTAERNYELLQSIYASVGPQPGPERFAA